MPVGVGGVTKIVMAGKFPVPEAIHPVNLPVGLATPVHVYVTVCPITSEINTTALLELPDTIVSAVVVLVMVASGFTVTVKVESAPWQKVGAGPMGVMV